MFLKKFKQFTIYTDVKKQDGEYVFSSLIADISQMTN